MRILFSSDGLQGSLKHFIDADGIDTTLLLLGAKLKPAFRARYIVIDQLMLVAYREPPPTAIHRGKSNGARHSIGRCHVHGPALRAQKQLGTFDNCSGFSWRELAA